ncbi:ABC transporter permease [Cetobacterium ceti]
MEKYKKLVYTIPFIGFMCMFFLYGLYYGVSNSFGYKKIVGKSGFTLEYYKKVLESRGFYESLFFTSKIAIISGIIAVLISIFVMYIFYLNLKYKYVKSQLFQRVIESPLLVPYLIGAYIILIFFMQSGILSLFLEKIGIIDNYKSFPIITNDKFGVGIIITYVWKTVPFILMMGIPVIKRINTRWDSLGKIFNLSDFQFFKKILLPLLFPTLTISFFIILAYFFASFETPYILGVTYPESLAVYVFNIYSRGKLEDRSIVMVINIFISLISLGTGVIVYLIFKFFKKYDEKGWL